MQVEHTITRDDAEIEIVAQCKYYRECRGHRDRYGCPEEPDEPAEVEIESVTLDIELTEAEIDAITMKAFDLAAEQYESNMCGPEE